MQNQLEIEVIKKFMNKKIISWQLLVEVDYMMLRNLKKEITWFKNSMGGTIWSDFKTKYNEKEVYFLPRHGRGHFVSPSNINFRANIDALKQLGVTDIVSVSAVGSLKENLPPGKFVIIDQFIDRTFARTKTFFDDEIVAHVSMAHPTSDGLMNACEEAIKKSNIDYQRNGTYVVMEGPQFSTLAESIYIDLGKQM